MNILIAFAILVILLVIGVPVPFCFGATVIWLIYGLGYSSSSMLSIGYTSINSFVLLAIPLFILAGGLMERGKIGKALTDLVELLVGRVKGGLGAVVVIASAIFGSICGSASATLTCIGAIMHPKLKDSGYPEGYRAALIASACPLGLLIPPSSAQILYAWCSGQSVLACFLSTVLPGIILVILLCAVNFVMARKMDLQEASARAKQTFMTPRKIVGRSVPALILPVIILGGIYGGIFTATEAAGVSVLYAIPVGFFVYKGMNWKSFKEALTESATTTGVVMVMFFMVMQLSRILTTENIPTTIAQALMAVSDNPVVILLMINVFMIIIGMLMDDTSGILLCTPILLPLVRELGVDPVQFAAILGVNLGMGNITPPTAPMLYLGGRVCRASISKMLKPNLIFIIFAWLPTLLLTTYIPQLALFLPRLFGLVD